MPYKLPLLIIQIRLSVEELDTQLRSRVFDTLLKGTI